MKLSDRRWKEFEIKNIFCIYNGKGITREEIDNNPGDFVAVQSAEAQNGCLGYIDVEYCKYKNYTMTEEKCLTVARTGSVAFVSYQANGCVVGDSAKILLLRNENFSKEEVYLFLRSILVRLREHYNFARKVTEEIYGNDIIKLPVDDNDEPDYQFMEDYIRSLNVDVSDVPDYFQNDGYDKACWYLDNIDVVKFEREYAGIRQAANIKLNDREWGEFKVRNLVNDNGIHKGYSYSNEELIDSTDDNYLCYVTRSDNNNGITRFVACIENYEEGNCLTIGDTTATCFYQKHKFTVGDHMIVIRADWINEYTGIFVASLLNKEKYRYPVFGRAFLMDNVKNTELKLPVDTDGKPDWQFMEDYIKSLPFSAKL